MQKTSPSASASSAPAVPTASAAPKSRRRPLPMCLRRAGSWPGYLPPTPAWELSGAERGGRRDCLGQARERPAGRCVQGARRAYAARLALTSAARRRGDRGVHGEPRSVRRLRGSAVRGAVPRSSCRRTRNPVKAAAVRALGAELVLRGAVFDECRDIAAQLAASTGAYYVDSGDEPKLNRRSRDRPRWSCSSSRLGSNRSSAAQDSAGSATGTRQAGACCPHRRSRRGGRVMARGSRRKHRPRTSPGAPGRRWTGRIRPRSRACSTGRAFDLPQRMMRAGLHDFLPARRRGDLGPTINGS